MPPSASRLQRQAVIVALKTAIKHVVFRQYPRDWDLTTHIQFQVLRKLDAESLKWTIEELQGFSMGYLPEPKEGWIIPINLDLSTTHKESLESEMRNTLQKLGPEFDLPEPITVGPLKGEWQGVLANQPDATSLTDKQKFQLYSENVKEGPVILYLHGGGYVTGNPEMARTATLKLAKLCKGRVFAVDYRLAPQNPFPAALLDALAAYKHLIDPPSEDALHEAIPPSKIIIAGDSAGGGLAIALTVYLINLDGKYPLPAGVIGLSPVVDMTGSFESTHVYRGLDWIPCLYEKPYMPKPSEAWNYTEAPRFDCYTDIPRHPLVSPVLLVGEIPSFPPLLMIVGDNEYLRDECLYFASRHADNDNVVQLQNYIGLPHVFVVFEKHPSTETCYNELAKFITSVTDGEKLETRMQVVNGKGKLEKPLDFNEYPIDFSKEEVVKRMEEAEARRRNKLFTVWQSMKLTTTDTSVLPWRSSYR